MPSEEYTEILVCGVKLHSVPSGLRTKRFRRGIAPVLSPPAHKGYLASPESSAQHIFGAKAEKTQVTWASDPQWGVSPGACRKVRPSSSSWRAQTGENKQPKPSFHLSLFIKLKGKRKNILSFKTNKQKNFTWTWNQSSIFQLFVSTWSQPFTSEQNAAPRVKLKHFNLPKASPPKETVSGQAKTFFGPASKFSNTILCAAVISMNGLP